MLSRILAVFFQPDVLQPFLAVPKLPHPAVFTVAKPLIFITPMAASFTNFQDHFSFAALRRSFDQVQKTLFDHNSSAVLWSRINYSPGLAPVSSPSSILSVFLAFALNSSSTICP